jgi:hypothetical protein
MGGNVKLPAGERAEKINIALMNIDAFNDFKSEMRNVFHDFNIMFERTYNYRLWPNVMLKKRSESSQVNGRQLFCIS